MIIGYSDYSRDQIESNQCGWTFGSRNHLLSRILEAEASGYNVTFETSIFRRIFCTGIYKIVATEKK